MKRTLLIFVILISNQIIAQENKTLINPVLFKGYWNAHWITHPSDDLNEYGVYHFRKSFVIDRISKAFIIHVSADNRYILFVNEHQVSLGPCRGNLDHWRFETVDIAQHLKIGKNVIAALVWNFGKYAPLAQISNMTAFLLQGDTGQEEILNTDADWKVIKNEAYSPVNPKKFINDYVAVGPGDSLDGSKYPWGWQKMNYDDSQWHQAKMLGRGVCEGGNRMKVWERKKHEYWTLVPCELPPMEERLIRFQKICRTDNIKVKAAFIEGSQALSIPPNCSCSILLDQSFLTSAYPVLKVSQGTGSHVAITYAEALLTRKGAFHKSFKQGNRNEIENREIAGYRDYFIPDGGDQRQFKPLDFRTYRYVQLDITTADEPLILYDFYGLFTAYPFEQKAYFKCDDRIWEAIWERSWRTLRLCANETYYDNPYFERMQYIGDTRVQALVSTYVSGDDRLMRNAIQLFDDTRLPNGLTLSRSPSTIPQSMPTWSLFWISMIYDHWLHYQDIEFVKKFMLAIKGVIKWFEVHLDETGMLGPMQGWIFVDWAFEDTGMPPGVWDGHSAVVSLQFVFSLQQAYVLAKACEMECDAAYYQALSEKIKAATHQLCWDQKRGLLADTPEKKNYSQHANIFAVLVDLFSQNESAGILIDMMNDTTITRCNHYFRFYYAEALKKVGKGDYIFDVLTLWKEGIELGLTTFPENPEPTRADCQGWSAVPDYILLSSIAGIRPLEPGFKRVIIAPSLGKLKWIRCAMPIPAGQISIDLSRKAKGIVAEIHLPAATNGRFIWLNKEFMLKSGNNKITVN